MKKIIIGILMMTIMLMGSAYAQTTPGFSNLDIVSTIYEPFPAEPGKYIDLYVKVENIGTRAAKNTEFELIQKYPFSSDSTEDAIKSFGSLEPAQPVLLTYKVRVDKNAVSGINTLNLRFKSGTDGLWFTVSFDIYVKSRDTVLSIENVKSYPDEITAGDKANVEFTLQNLANTQIKDISLKLDVSGTTLPFAPVDSTTEKRIDVLESFKEKKITFEIITDASAEPKVYKIPIILTYTDESGTTFTKNDIISLLISSDPELEIYMEESDKFQGGKKGSVVFSVSNVGATQAKFVTIELEESDNYEIIGPKRTYIGNLDSDDFDTVEYTIYVDKSLNDTKIPLNVKVSYKDAYNNIHYKNSEQILTIYSLDDLIRLGEATESGNSNNIIIIIVLIVILYFVYRYFRRRKAS